MESGRLGMRLSLELLDIVEHSRPGLSDIRVLDTVANLNERHGSFMSYDAGFRDCRLMTTGLVTDAALRKLSYDPRDWVQNAILEVALAMNGFLGTNGGKWIPVGRRRVRVLNKLWVKPSIRGILIRDRIAAPVLVVTRKSILVDLPDVLPFLMRGGYEFHLRDDPNLHDFIVLDLSGGKRGEARNQKVYRLSETGMMPLEEFEHIVTTYGAAASASKYGLHIPAGVAVSDLFRRGSHP